MAGYSIPSLLAHASDTPVLEDVEDEEAAVLDAVEGMNEDEEGLGSATMTAVEEEDESVVVDVSIEEVEDQIDVAVVAGFAAEAVGEDEAEQAQGIEPGMATAPPMRRLAAI